MNITVLETRFVRDWSLKWMSCLGLGTVSMATAVMALLGIISQPQLTWRARVVLSLLLHPMHIAMGFVALFFGMVKLDDVIGRPGCTRLVFTAVTSQWGVIISTLVIGVGRSGQLLLDKRCLWAWLELSVGCLLTPCAGLCSAIVLVVCVYIFTLELCQFSLPQGFISATVDSCPTFLSSQELFPRRELGWCLLVSIFLALVSTVVIMTHIRQRRRGLRSVQAMRAHDLFRLQPLARPPADEQPHVLQEFLIRPDQLQPAVQLEQAQDVNENALSTRFSILRAGLAFHSRRAAQPEEHQAANQFYDDEHRRHRAQSPPPAAANQDVPEGHPFVIVQPPLPPQVHNNVNDGIGAGHHFVFPEVYLDLIFPHRETQANKKRFPYTKVQHKRKICLNVISLEDTTGSLAGLHPNLLDQVICSSNLLFIVAYAPVAFYLLYTHNDPAYPFTSQSFQPFLSVILAKAALDSFIYFLSLQMLQ